MTSLVSVLIAGKMSFYSWECSVRAQTLQTRSHCVMSRHGEVMLMLPVLSEEVPAGQSVVFWRIL